MLFRLVWKASKRRMRRWIIATVAIAAGTALAIAILNISLDIAERMAKELREYGANILVIPKGERLTVDVAGVRYAASAKQEYLAESSLAKLKEIFWKHNIVGFAPFLYGQVEVNGRRATLAGTWYEKEVPVKEGSALKTGIEHTSPSWRIAGKWFEAGSKDVVLGAALAERLGTKPGDRVKIQHNGHLAYHRVIGLLRTGGFEEEQVFIDLKQAQEMLNLPGKVETVMVSALVKPDDKLVIRAGSDPKRRLPPEEFEKWYCSPYLSAITYQIEEAIPQASAKAIRQVAEAEGTVLTKLKLIFVLISLLAVVAAGLGVMASVSGTVLERKPEIGLMKVLGAENGQIIRHFLMEAALSGVLGGLAGFMAGGALSKLWGKVVFGVTVSQNYSLMPVAFLIALGVAAAGSALPLRTILKIQPAVSLKGG